MNHKEIRYELEKIQEMTVATWHTLGRALRENEVILGETDVYVQGYRYMVFYNNLFCIQADLRDLMKKLEPFDGKHTGENIIDFTDEAPKHRNKPKVKKDKPL